MALRVIWQYMDRSVTKTYYMDRSEFEQNPEENIILIGPYCSIWAGPSPKKYYMDRSF